MSHTDYASLKPYFLSLYILFGVALLCLANVSKRAFAAKAYGRGGRLAPALIVAAALPLLAIFVLSGSQPLTCAVIIAAFIFGFAPGGTAPRTLCAGLATVVIVLSLAWWRITRGTAAPLPLIVFALCLGGCAFGLSLERWRARRFVAVPIIVFLVAGLCLVADLGAYRAGAPALFTLAHHWGAFIGPALHLRAGLVPLYDVPLQYGLGPTLALAAACDGSDCWRGAQLIFSGTTLVEGLLVLAMALAPTIPRSPLWYVTATVVVFAAVFLWPGFPAVGNLLMATPSSGGIRFLPVTAVAGLLFFGFPQAATLAMIPAMLWSPESAAMSATVFGLCETARRGLLRAALLTAGLLVGSYGALFLVHRMIYGVWIDPAALIEYVIHVPGPLPIKPVSDIILLAVALGVGGWLSFRAAEDPAARCRDLVVTALLFAAAAYSLGRSHPNNICNLAPFLVLVGFRALERPGRDQPALSKATVFALAVSVAALALSPWQSIPYDPHATLDIHAIVADFPTLQPDIDRIRRRIPNPAGLGIADFGPLFARNPAETVLWTPMDPTSLWSYVPSARRRIYIERAAMRLRRAGWAIIGVDGAFLLEDLASAYNPSDRQSFTEAPSKPGDAPLHYEVVCFTPKPTLAARIEGATCPSGTVSRR